MKLRNKKTGKIITSKELLTDEFIIDLFSRDFDYFNSRLHKIEDEWENYDEPKDKYFWFFDEEGIIRDTKEENWSEESVAAAKAIGNYFETKEEAEKAVVKLKAWKRLKDKGLYFVRDAVNEGVYEHNFVLRPMMPKDKRYVSIDKAKEIYNDIKLIFDLNIKEVKNNV